ncbi:MAG: hypothetical protein QF569_27855 [Candidatus Poribacteria bacterium]|nr:hypothetical protein [Candidatus Poribacteria bacterium]
MARTNNAPRDLGLTLLTTVARTIDFYQIDAGDYRATRKMVILK